MSILRREYGHLGNDAIKQWEDSFKQQPSRLEPAARDIRVNSTKYTHSTDDQRPDRALPTTSSTAVDDHADDAANAVVQSGPTRSPDWGDADLSPAPGSGSASSLLPELRDRRRSVSDDVLSSHNVIDSPSEGIADATGPRRRQAQLGGETSGPPSDAAMTEQGWLSSVSPADDAASSMEQPPGPGPERIRSAIGEMPGIKKDAGVGVPDKGFWQKANRREPSGSSIHLLVEDILERKVDDPDLTYRRAARALGSHPLNRRLAELTEAYARSRNDPDLADELERRLRGIAAIPDSHLELPSDFTDADRTALNRFETETLTSIRPVSAADLDGDDTSPRQRYALRSPDGTPIATLDAASALALARNTTLSKHLIGLIGLAGDHGLQDPLVRERMEALLVDRRHPAGQMRRHGKVVEDRSRFEAFEAAQQMIAEGADPQRVWTLTLPLLLPPEDQTGELLLGLALDMLPIIGQVRAGISVAENGSAFLDSARNGDLEGMALNGLFTLLDAASILPGIGVLTRATARGLRNVPGLGALDARRRLAQARDRGPQQRNRSDPNYKSRSDEVFGDTLNGVDARFRSSLQSALSNTFGPLGEEVMHELYRRAGSPVVRQPSGTAQTSVAVERLGRTATGKMGQRRFDGMTDVLWRRANLVMRLLFGEMLVPVRGSRMKTFGEAKTEGGSPTTRQAIADEAILNAEGKFIRKEKIDGEDITILEDINEADIHHFYFSVHEIPPDRLRETFTRMIDTPALRKLGKEKKQDLLNELMAWQQRRIKMARDADRELPIGMLIAEAAIVARSFLDASTPEW